MNFKVDDIVKVINIRSHWYERSGIVTQVSPNVEMSVVLVPSGPTLDNHPFSSFRKIISKDIFIKKLYYRYDI